MNKNYGIIKTMVSLGLTKRASLLLFAFTTTFLIFACWFCLTLPNGNKAYSLFIACLIPLFVIDILLGYLAISPKFCDVFKREEENRKLRNIKKESIQNSSIGRKAYVGMACHGSAVGIGILLLCFLIVTGQEKYIFEIFAGYIFLGIPLIYKVLWPILQKKLD